MVRALKALSIAALISGVFHVHSAGASDSRGSYMVYGAGTVSCGKWTEVRKLRVGVAGEQWLAGFVTAFNLYGFGGEDAANGIDMSGLAGWIDNYCQKNPLDNLSRAAESLVTELLVKSGKRPGN